MSSDHNQDTGTTPLHSAVECRDTTMLEHLIDQGCNVNAQSDSGDTPLILAVQKCSGAIVDALLRANGDVFMTNRSGVSPLEMAFRACLRCVPLKSASANFMILQKLLEKTIRDFSTNKRATAQSVLASNESVKLIVVAGGNVELAEVVLKNGYPVNFQEPSRGLTALHCSVIFSKIENAKLLLAHRANICAGDLCRYSALFHYTDDCQDNDENADLLKSLLKRSTSLHLPDERGYTDFEYLLMYGKEKTVRALLENAMQSGTDVTATRFRGGRSLVHVVIDNVNEGVVRVLDELDIHFDASSLNALDSDGHTALMSAARRSNESAFKYLMKNRIIARTASLYDPSPFAYAVKLHEPTDPTILDNMTEVTKLLLKRGADAQFVTLRGATLLSDLRNQRENPNFEIMNPSAKVIIAHLALLGALDDSLLTDRTRSEIQTEPLFEAHFFLCTQQLTDMKNVGVYGNVTLFKLLTEKEKNIAGYARNRDLILAFNSTIKKSTHFDSFYIDSLQTKMSRAIYANELYETAAPIVEKLTGLFNDVYRVIIYEILSYLSFRDLQNISLVYE